MGGGEGTGGALDMGSTPPPLRDKLWIRPWCTVTAGNRCVFVVVDRSAV